MPIKVTCSCGQTFTAKDELSGQTLLCPKCHQPITIGESAKAAPRKAAKRGGLVDLFEEAGFEEVRGPRCPQCGEGMAPDALLCVHCGFHKESGDRVKGANVRSDEHGLSQVAEMMMKKAKDEIAFDKIEDKKNRSQGAPAWFIFLILMIVCGFTATMYLLPRNEAVFYTGIAVIALGGLLQVICLIRILIIAFMERLLHGFLCLVIPPFYLLFYIFTRWRVCKRFVATAFSSLFIELLGWGMIQLAPAFDPTEARPFPDVRNQQHQVMAVRDDALHPRMVKMPDPRKVGYHHDQAWIRQRHSSRDVS